jgi:hypothetical protein
LEMWVRKWKHPMTKLILTHIWTFSCGSGTGTGSLKLLKYVQLLQSQH